MDDMDALDLAKVPPFVLRSALQFVDSILPC